MPGRNGFDALCLSCANRSPSEMSSLTVIALIFGFSLFPQGEFDSLRFSAGFGNEA